MLEQKLALCPSQDGPKSSNSSLHLRNYVFQKVAKYLGYFLNKICHRDLSKIAQSGHTGQKWILLHLLHKFLPEMDHGTGRKRIKGNKIKCIPGLVVMVDDSCSEVVGSNILDGHFFTLICCKNCIVCLKRPKIN